MGPVCYQKTIISRVRTCEGIESCRILSPTRYPLRYDKILLYVFLIMTPAGFEPAHPKINELKSFALDHSAIVSVVLLLLNTFFDANQIKSLEREKGVAVCIHKKPSAGLEPATLRLKVLCSTD